MAEGPHGTAQGADGTSTSTASCWRIPGGGVPDWNPKANKGWFMIHGSGVIQAYEGVLLISLAFIEGLRV